MLVLVSQLVSVSLSRLVLLSESEWESEIPAIPHVDAIVCQVKLRDVVCEVIGKHVLDVSGGVCCSVAGVRYEPGLSEAA